MCILFVLHWQERPAHPCAFRSSADQKRLVDESLDVLDVGRGRVERPGRGTRCGLTDPPTPELYPLLQTTFPICASSLSALTRTSGTSMRVSEQRRPKTTRGRKPRRTENTRFCIGKNVRHIHARFGAAQTKNDSWTKASTCSTSVGVASRGRGEGLDVA